MWVETPVAVFAYSRLADRHRTQLHRRRQDLLAACGNGNQEKEKGRQETDFVWREDLSESTAQARSSDEFLSF
jgi:hypothetical protein